MSAEDKVSTPLSGLLDTLELLVAQARAYERALPAENYPARAATTLGELAHQALNDARDLRSLMETPETPIHNPKLYSKGIPSIGGENPLCKTTV